MEFVGYISYSLKNKNKNNSNSYLLNSVKTKIKLLFFRFYGLNTLEETTFCTGSTTFFNPPSLSHAIYLHDIRAQVHFLSHESPHARQPVH